MKNRGQVTIFIIVSILVISSVLLFFLWVEPTYISERAGIKGFEGCIEDVLDDGIGELEGRGGFVDSDFTYAYNGEDFTYLCYTGEYYRTCTVQAPLLKRTFNDNLEILIRDDVEACYGASLESLKGQGYEVEEGDVEYDVDIEPGIVRMKINAPTTVGGNQFTKFSAKTNAPTYEMLMIATSILQFESKYGDTDTSAMMLYYPDYYIEKVKRGEGTSVYTLEHKILGNKFKFASRSLVFPAGYDI